MHQRHAIDAQMNIDLEGMRVFVELANRGSSGEASGALARSRPTLSRRFQRLEASLSTLCSGDR
jgi:DNA-binding transcriptional LysR family regulator